MKANHGKISQYVFFHDFSFAALSVRLLVTLLKRPTLQYGRVYCSDKNATYEPHTGGWWCFATTPYVTISKLPALHNQNHCQSKHI